MMKHTEVISEIMSQSAIIFDIQRGSYVDGPGMRTVIFFKGCNLHCAWCHNPESRERKIQLLYYENRCAHCGRCISACPVHAVSEADHGVDRTKCTACGRCAEVCPEDARSLCGKTKDTAELMRIIRKDVPYYRQSGGGVTFSGGECMLQPEALGELLRACRKDGIQTAVDTAGNVPWERFEELLPVTDLFLYDLKHTDPEKHRAGTGVSNERILSNLEALLDRVPERVIIRTPVIPGFNDGEDDLRAIGRWLGEHPKPLLYEPLPFHKLGDHKAAALGEEPFAAEQYPNAVFDEKKQLIFQAMKAAETKEGKIER